MKVTCQRGRCLRCWLWLTMRVDVQPEGFVMRAAPVLQLLCKILCAETACVTMLVENGVQMQQGTGLLTEKTIYPQPGVCHWMLVPDRPQTMIVEDMHLDARSAPQTS